MPKAPDVNELGRLVITSDMRGRIVAVSRQDDESETLSVLATSAPFGMKDHKLAELVNQLTDAAVRFGGASGAGSIRDLISGIVNKALDEANVRW